MKLIGGSVSVTFAQDGDSCSDNDEQYLTVTIKDAGGGAYLVFKTSEWAIDNVDEFVEKINRVWMMRGLVEGDDATD